MISKNPLLGVVDAMAAPLSLHHREQQASSSGVSAKNNIFNHKTNVFLYSINILKVKQDEKENDNRGNFCRHAGLHGM